MPISRSHLRFVAWHRRPTPEGRTHDLHRNPHHEHHTDVIDADPTHQKEYLMNASIQINGLTKRFGNVVAVDNLSFEVAQGSVTGFLGPNGAGKTTTLRMLLGLIEPTTGSSTINGKP